MPEKSEFVKPITAINTLDFARSVGIEPNSESRYIFGPEHIEPAYYYAQNLKKEGRIKIDGIASPAVIASLIHGAHPAEAFVSFQTGDESSDIKIYEPIPEGEGKGPMTWKVTKNPDYTLVEFVIKGGILKLDDISNVIPPEIETDRPVIISGRGPVALTQTIAASYCHYKDMPAVAFYQPAVGDRSAQTQVGITHDVNYPMGLSFGEPAEIGSAQEKHFAKIISDLEKVSAVLAEKGIDSSVSGTSILVSLPDGDLKLDIKGSEFISKP